MALGLIAIPTEVPFSAIARTDVPILYATASMITTNSGSTVWERLHI